MGLQRSPLEYVPTRVAINQERSRITRDIPYWLRSACLSRETASEVREMIGILTGDLGDPEPRIAPISLIDMRRAS
jgi:hypothetical protein